MGATLVARCWCRETMLPPDHFVGAVESIPQIVERVAAPATRPVGPVGARRLPLRAGPLGTMYRRYGVRESGRLAPELIPWT